MMVYYFSDIWNTKEKVFFLFNKILFFEIILLNKSIVQIIEINKLTMNHLTFPA